MCSEYAARDVLGGENKYAIVVYKGDRHVGSTCFSCRSLVTLLSRGLCRVQECCQTNQYIH